MAVTVAMAGSDTQHGGHGASHQFGVGQGADWFPADRDFLTLSKDGKLLVEVQLNKGGSLKLSRAVARASLTQP